MLPSEKLANEARKDRRSPHGPNGRAAGAHSSAISGGQMLQLISSAIASVAAEEQPLSTENTNVGGYFSQLAMRYAEQGRPDEAERLFRQALEVAKNGPSQSVAALDRNLDELASFYTQRGKYKEAEPLLEKIAELRWRELSPDNELFTHSLSNLATVYEKTGKLGQAEALYKTLLSTQEQRFGPDSLEVVDTLNRLANCYIDQENLAGAESLYLRILLIEEYTFGTCSPEINSTVEALVRVFQKQGKWALVDFMLQKQRSILEELHGPDAVCVASCLLRWANILVTNERMDAAEPLFLRALDIHRKAYGNDSSLVTSFRRKLAQLFPEKYISSPPPVNGFAHSAV
jgi:tetratricopeptide (TPR) repeat protein